VTTIETGNEHLLARLEDGVAVVTFNRPERRNALTASMLAALARSLAGFEKDNNVRCIILTGAGGAFCAGGDLRGTAEENLPGKGRREPLSYDARVQWQRINQRETAGRLWSMPKPTIAMITGPAAGAGLALALACDLRFAASAAVLTTAFARAGLAGDYGGTWFLTRLVGAAKARELYFFSERITAEEGARLGIVNSVFAPDDLENETFERAGRLARGPSIAYRYMKENLNRAVNGELGECLDIEATHHLHTSMTADHREAAQAFVDRREPVFVNR
jgi:2-(1,2-epoxy-1,2-dihydrophenyl)acetyl-CoA isomerase